MSPSERLLQFTIQASTSVEDFWTLRCEMSEKLREKLATLSGEQLTEVKRRALEVLRKYSTERGSGTRLVVMTVPISDVVDSTADRFAVTFKVCCEDPTVSLKSH